ncbi:leukemia inhibitory factor receptor [Cyprinodon tularosa]|uniref:leukemia inhibitory factor receptor n=1 Tax=Cyprinodon tularosa TaxID=77115 RepID=UPI0018E2605F|nr:leukemia inhibitory factor receptor [Cyprinodon tularosa]
MRNNRVFCTHLLGLCLILYDARSEGCGGYGSPPPPPNISHSSDKQSLELSWLRIQGTSERDVYEIQISRTENHLIIDKMSKAAADSAQYNLMWFSDLPLECVDHSVRMRLFCNQTFHSPWSTWITHHGIKATDKSQIFPSGKILKEGSNATFCCIPRVNANIAKISFERKSFDLLNNTYGVKAILVTNLTIPDRLFKLLVLVCSESTGKTVDTFNYISFPPQKPRNLSCTTSDMKSINCTWDLDRKRDEYDRNKQNITLHIESTDHPPISCQPQSCIFQADQQQQEYKIRVEIKDKLGEENATYSFNIAERVSPALKWDKVIPGVTNVSLSLNVSVLKNMTCQVWLDTENTKESLQRITIVNEKGLCNVLLDGLHFNTSYSARVRCSVNGIFWGEWTPTKKFTTYPLVTLDLWRKIQSNPSSDTRNVTLLWKPHVFSKEIQSYKIKWSRGGQPQTEEKDGGERQADILIGPELSNITVQAVPKFGSSIPAHITIPPKDESEIPQLKKHLNNISAAGLHLWWEKQISVTCGYTVVWCRRTAASNLDWIKVPKENNTLFIPTEGNFKRGHRYSFNIYGCSENGDKLLEIQTGYMQGNDPRQKSVTIDGLQPHQDYVCCACEVTKVGRGLPDTWMTETNNDLLLVQILIPIILFLTCIIILWAHRKKLWKELKKIFVYPAGMNIKDLQFESFLFETDKKLHSQKVEEPISSDIEVLNITSLRHEHTTLRNPKQTSTMCSLTSYSPVPSSCVQLQTGYRPQCTAWLCERPEPQQMICVSNYSYLNPITEPNEVEFTENEPSLETSDSIQGPYAVYCYTCDSQF